MPAKLTTEEFIMRAKKIHGDKYDYGLVDYKDANTKIKIICPKHGIFEQKPAYHLYRRQVCRKCTGLAKSNTLDWIKKARKVHKNKYDYSLVDYKNNQTKIKIICPKHGIFEQVPNNHISKSRGCSKCANRYNYSTKEFIQMALVIHSDKYDYSLVEYKNAKSKVKIICPEHGLFEQSLDHHINQKSGCPKCKESIGEREIRIYLENKNIKYIQEYKFDDCRNINTLPFDFYIPKYNLCIEYDGIQHYQPQDIFGGEPAFRDLQIRDKIKTQYCKDNNIRLIRIKYNKDVIETLNEKSYFSRG